MPLSGSARHGAQVVWTDQATHNSRGPEAPNRWLQRGLRLLIATATWCSRQSALSPREVARMLGPGGRLLTNQGHTEWRGETLADVLGASGQQWTIPGLG